MPTIEQINAIINSYSKDKIQKNWLPLVSKFYIENRDKTWQKINGEKMVGMISQKKLKSKDEIGSFSFSVFQNREVYQEFLASLPLFLPPIIEKLVWQQYITKKELELMHPDPIMRESPYFREKEILVPFGIFEIDKENIYHSWHSSSFAEEYKILEFNLSLSAQVTDCIREYYTPPDGYTIREYALDEKDKTLKIFKAEPGIHSEIPRIIAYVSQGNIKYSEKGKPNAAGMAKMQRTLALQEFFDAKEIHTSRCMLIAGLVYGYKLNNMAVESVKVIAHIINKNYFNIPEQAYPQPIAPFLLTRLKGLNYIYFNDFNTKLQLEFRQILLQFPEKGWVSYDNIFTYLKTHFIDSNPIDKYYILNKLSIEVPRERDYYSNTRSIKRTEISTIVTEPYIKANLFLLASLGIIDIAYTEVDTGKIFGKDWYSEYDGVKAVRLTSLGKYILGINKEYETPETTKNKLIFDENSLIVRAEGDMALIQTVLGNYVSKASNNRYSFDTGFFLKDCKNSKEIIIKIANFKKSIGTKLPIYWENHLASLVQNAHVIKVQYHTYVFELPVGNKTLHHLMATDLIIKKLILKAEQFQILVTKSNLLKFKNRMKELGYLIDETGLN